MTTTRPPGALRLCCFREKQKFRTWIQLINNFWFGCFEVLQRFASPQLYFIHVIRVAWFSLRQIVASLLHVCYVKLSTSSTCAFCYCSVSKLVQKSNMLIGLLMGARALRTSRVVTCVGPLACDSKELHSSGLFFGFVNQQFAYFIHMFEISQQM